MLPDSKTVLLTVPSYQEKLDATLAHLSSHGITPYIYQGFDKITGIETLHTYEVDHPGSGYRIGPKMVNMVLSHFSLWRALALFSHGTGCQSFVILEDDVRLEPDWREHLAVALTHLPSDWDLFYLGSCNCQGQAGNQLIWGRLHSTKYVLCTHAYAIAAKALPVLIASCQKVWTHIDIAIQMEAMNKLSTFVLLPRIATQHDTMIYH